MTERMIFGELKLFKKEITERFLLLLQEIYRHHPAFLYDDDEDKTKILIYPSYADPDRDGKQPRMTVKTGAYNLSLMDTLNSNMSKEVFLDGRLAGYKHEQIITVPLTVIIQSYVEEESSDLGDELANLIVFACQEMVRGSGFLVRGIQVSETDLYDRSKKLYQTSVSMTADVPWSWTKQSKTPAFEDIGIDIINDPLIIDGYRPPGAYVVQYKQKGE